MGSSLRKVFPFNLRPEAVGGEIVAAHAKANANSESIRTWAIPSVRRATRQLPRSTRRGLFAAAFACSAVSPAVQYRGASLPKSWRSSAASTPLLDGARCAPLGGGLPIAGRRGSHPYVAQTVSLSKAPPHRELDSQSAQSLEIRPPNLSRMTPRESNRPTFAGGCPSRTGPPRSSHCSRSSVLLGDNR